MVTWKGGVFLGLKYYKYLNAILLMYLIKEQIEQIRQFSLAFYERQDFAHDTKHMNKTIEIAKFIAEKENVSQEIVALGAIVHQFHDNLNELIMFLKSINMDQEIIDKLSEIVEFRPFKGTSKENVSLEAKVVYDADALQVLGPNGIVREIACNIHARNKTLDKSVEDARKIEQQFHDSLQTETAKKMIDRPHRLMKKFWKIYDAWEDDDFL